VGALAPNCSGGTAVCTLLATIPANGTLQNFVNAQGSAFFDMVTAARGNNNGIGVGDANQVLATQGVANPQDPLSCKETGTPGCSDAIFSETFSTGAVDTGYQVSGTAFIKTNAIPEPASLSLLAAGLFAFGLGKRKWRRKA